MENCSVAMDEIVTVGLRYGMKADVVAPLFERKEPIDLEKAVKILGFDEVILSPVSNPYDIYAVAVYTPQQEFLGHVWMYQAPSIRSWMKREKRKYINAKVTMLCTTAGVLMIKPELPITFSPDERNSPTVNEQWAMGLPQTLTSLTEYNLTLSLHMLCSYLEKDLSWSEELQKQIDHLLTFIPSDLSCYHYHESFQLFNLLSRCTDPKVVAQGEMILASFVHRGSDAQMKWWLDHWLPEFYKVARVTDLADLYNISGFTLERVEELLEGAPAHLFHFYQFNRERFVKQLYYAALPLPVYTRLLTLLAVRENMLEKSRGMKKREVVRPQVVENDFSLLVTNPERAAEVVDRIHQLMEGKVKPKDVAMPLRAAMEAGALSRPTWEAFYQEFGNGRIKSKSSYSSYTNLDSEPYHGEDFNQMVNDFKNLIL